MVHRFCDKSCASYHAAREAANEEWIGYRNAAVNRKTAVELATKAFVQYATQGASQQDKAEANRVRNQKEAARKARQQNRAAACQKAKGTGGQGGPQMGGGKSKKSVNKRNRTMRTSARA